MCAIISKNEVFARKWEMERQMAFKNKLSIYLIKDEFAAEDNQILKSGCELLADIEGVGKVYYNPSHTSQPDWVNSFFCGQLGDASIFTSNARAVLLARVTPAASAEKTFAITMGYGKFMLADDVIEDDFGLKVVLNTITPNSLRRINKTNIGGNQKTSNEQLPLESDIDDFGFDIDRDLISTITGRSDVEDYASGIMTGGDLLSLTAEVDINNLSGFLRATYSRYTSTEYKNYFPWIDQIRKVKDSRVIDALDAELINLINAGSPKVWMAVPEVIQWEHIAGFKYAGRDVHDDILVDTLKNSFREGLTNVGQLKNRTVTAVRADNGDPYASWQAYKCVYGEVELGGKVYCVNNGRWFCIDRDFVNQINTEYSTMPVSDRTFLPHSIEHKTENDYTVAFVASDPDHLLCMDAKVIMYGGGQSKVELCDIRTTDNTYIHIKPYSSSSTLSHLFNQAVVSAELVLGDPIFIGKANEKIRENTTNPDFLIDGNGDRPTIILAIISKDNSERPQIPFFSKVALRYTRRRLETDGCKLYIKNIKKA